jgi:anti-anti-sigma regulatory factor
LRITTNQDSTTATLKLEGRLAAAWVPECMQALESVLPSLGAKQLCLDLRDLTFVDRRGAQLLSEIYKEHRVQFLTSTPLTKYFAEQAINASNAEIAKGDKGDGRVQ